MEGGGGKGEKREIESIRGADDCNRDKLINWQCLYYLYLLVNVD